MSLRDDSIQQKHLGDGKFSAKISNEKRKI